MSDAQTPGAFEQCPVDHERLRRLNEGRFMGDVLQPHNPQARYAARLRAMGSPSSYQRKSRDRALKSLDELTRSKANAFGAVAGLCVEVVQDVDFDSVRHEAAQRVGRSSLMLTRPAKLAAVSIEAVAINKLKHKYASLRPSEKKAMDSTVRRFLQLKQEIIGSAGAAVFLSRAEPAVDLITTGLSGAATRSTGMIAAAMHAQPTIDGRPVDVADMQQPLLIRSQLTTVPSFLSYFGTLIPQFLIDTHLNAGFGRSFNPDLYRFDPRYVTVDQEGRHRIDPSVVDKTDYYITDERSHIVAPDPKDQFEATLRGLEFGQIMEKWEVDSLYVPQVAVGCPISLVEHPFEAGAEYHSLAGRVLELTMSGMNESR